MRKNGESVQKGLCFRGIEKFIIRQPPMGEKDDYDSENSWISGGLPNQAEEGGEEVGGERWESGERSEVQARSTLTSTAPKARPRSGEVATLDEVPRRADEAIFCAAESANC